MSSSSNVRMLCPNLACRALLTVPAAARGKQVICGKCGSRVAVPAKPAAAPAGDA